MANTTTPHMSTIPGITSTGLSTRLPQYILHRLGMLRDHGQQHARGRVGARPALTRVGASGRDRPCSQFLSVAGGKPNLVANCAWLSPIFARTSRTSTFGTCARVTRTLSFSPRVHAIACSNPSTMRAPTVGRFFATRPTLFAARLVFVFTLPPIFARYPATRTGDNLINCGAGWHPDRKSTRLNSSHLG